MMMIVMMMMMMIMMVMMMHFFLNNGSSDSHVGQISAFLGPSSVKKPILGFLGDFLDLFSADVFPTPPKIGKNPDFFYQAWLPQARLGQKIDSSTQRASGTQD